MSNDGQTEEEQAAATSGAAVVLLECTKAVEDYRGGTINKAQALLVIATQLVGAETQSNGTPGDSATIQSYLAMLDERTERERRAAGTPESIRAPEPSRSRESSEEMDEQPSKRAKVDPASYAWAASEFLLESQLHPHVARTLELIRVYGEDLAQAKRHINSSAAAPEFPEAEWANVLTGRAIDLDHVFAGRYTPGSEEKVSERIGELELSYRAPVPAKKISNFGDWVFAWKRASVAVTFAFPHRREELDDYGEYIIGLFGALAPEVHTRVLDFDRAVRKRVGAARRYLLTDINNFADLRLQYIDACGANVYRAQASARDGGPVARRPTGGRQKDACRRWNSEEGAGCPSRAGECPYRHACSACGARGHKRHECAKNARAA
ncbi:uncharacterized protein TRAVEDRAFT_137181 [Trametes versicolor FP-101664 SS1]|uniref:C3H1-type domain-containing protein n=1 Tax=Trametes versicolor (strain FP-101664) TaxID=717944 RepID=R7S7L2_TRAVS|nr:uncharacterized protein TRAVEDRAFT_137181 [Trametes versicolor FP-101664 SS1]EIW51630.1 hypothetical protein TRAVEDRAFT_137181 [Trametes versicolor FP-101664 SS1]